MNRQQLHIRTENSAAPLLSWRCRSLLQLTCHYLNSLFRKSGLYSHHTAQASSRFSKSRDSLEGLQRGRLTDLSSSSPITVCTTLCRTAAQNPPAHLLSILPRSRVKYSPREPGLRSSWRGVLTLNCVGTRIEPSPVLQHRACAKLGTHLMHHAKHYYFLEEAHESVGPPLHMYTWRRNRQAP